MYCKFYKLKNYMFVVRADNECYHLTFKANWWWACLSVILVCTVCEENKQFYEKQTQSIQWKK